MTELDVEKRIMNSGLRYTAQRGHVYSSLCAGLDHPTAEEVFMKVKANHPDISMATVYNCLEKFARADLVRQVRLGSGATRYCPNMRPHAHFLCEACGTAHDLEWDEVELLSELKVPNGFIARGLDGVVHGLCSDCSEKSLETS